VGLDLVDQRGALFGRERGVQLVECVGRRVVDARGGRGELRQRGVDLRCVDGAGGDAVGQGLEDGLLGGARWFHVREEVGLDLVDGGALLGGDTQGVEAHRDEHRDAAVMMVAVVLAHVGRGLVFGLRR